jgi:delta-1-pyrroline-5-carboxylate synthetase
LTCLAQLQNEGKEMLMVTSGAVAFGKQKLGAAIRMSMSMRETLSPRESIRKAQADILPEPRCAAAVGQSGLMALYDAMFSQYGVNIAQVRLFAPIIVLSTLLSRFIHFISFSSFSSSYLIS